MGAEHPEASVAMHKSTPKQVHLETSVAMVMSAAAGIALKELWHKGKSTLEKVHLSVCDSCG